MPSSAPEGGGAVRAERIDGALLLTLHRPEAGNALDEATAAALLAQLDAAAADPALRCVVLAGTGRFFCAGGDLKAYRAIATPEALARVFGGARALLDAIEALPVPVVAAIDGYALGGGAELALACDLRIAGAVVGFPQLRLGIVTGWDGAERLVELVGRGTATRLLLTGERLDAAAAHEAGLVEILAPDAGEAALALAASLARAAPLAIRGCKTVLRAARGDRPHGTARRRSAADVFERLWFTEDHREAERACAEKREPAFHGR